MKARCPIQGADKGRIVQCVEKINPSDGMCAPHWSLVPPNLRQTYVNMALNGRPADKFAALDDCIRAAENNSV